jgi:hypothetical protein
MSVRQIALVASLVATSLSLSTSPLLAAAPDLVTPDIGVRVAPVGTHPGAIEVAPWVWEPDSSDSLRIAVGTRARRIIVRVWFGPGAPRGRFIEQRRVGRHWRSISRTDLSAADLAGGSTDPTRTRYERPGFLAFDASTLGVEVHGGLAYSVVASAGERLSIRFGAHDHRTGRWSDLSRTVND